MEADPDPLLQPFPAAASEHSLAVRLLRTGRVIVYPTETFYGLFADAFCVEALERIAHMKGRNGPATLPCIIGKPEDLPKLALRVTGEQHLLMEKFWPGPLTLVFSAAKQVPEQVTGGTGTVGVRLTGYADARAVSAEAGPLVATSANLSGQPPAGNAGQLTEIFPGTAVFDGGTLSQSKGSTVVDVRTKPYILIRDGDLPVGQIEKTLGADIERGQP